MANSIYGYVRQFEQSDAILPNTWIVVRIDGRAFHRFSSTKDFTKPNDIRALSLMNAAAGTVFGDVQDVVLAYGQSDEFSFVLPPYSSLFDRRASKLVSTIVSTFTAYYILYWPNFFPQTPLITPPPAQAPSQPQTSSLPTIHSEPHPGTEPETTQSGVVPASSSEMEPAASMIKPSIVAPTFDGRAVAYPRVKNLRDYMSWRQADCHINNLFNTTFWALVQQGGMSHHEAEQSLQGTLAADKNEILFSRFGINYNNEPAIFRKGSVLYRDHGESSVSVQNAQVDEAATDPSTSTSNHIDESREAKQKRQPDRSSRTQQTKERKRKAKAKIVVQHVDVIEDAFWEARPWILG